jgi:oligopeptide transport system permease protein
MSTEAKGASGAVLVSHRTSPGSGAWPRFRANRTALAALVVVGCLATLSLVAPLLADVGLLADPYELDFDDVNAGPSGEHVLGTDYVGRDLLSRAIFGTRISLSVALGVQVLILVVGGAVGLVAGYMGGKTDNLLMRATDAVFAFPELVFVLMLAAVFGPGYWNVLLAIGAVGWAYLARLVRGEALSIKERQYVDAARAAGTSGPRLVLGHVVPNSLGPVIVLLTFGVPSAIFAEAFLSFIGVGIPPPTPSLGVMVDDGYQAIFAYPHQVLVPAVAIAIITLTFTHLGDGLRDALDPRFPAKQRG